ncbi:MAG: hypothetical protein M3130_03125 [Actinomycetota bacterium]|nr:hypothetical protein [Actinomycetota bacterium]
MAGMAMMLFLNFGTANVAPWWVTTLLVLLWLVLFAMGCRWFVSRPLRVVWLPIVGFAVWLPTILVGTSQWGWGR